MRLNLDDTARLTAESARGIRSGRGRAAVRRAPAEALLGAFASLAPHAQREVRQLIHDDTALRLRCRSMAGWHLWLTRLLWGAPDPTRPPPRFTAARRFVRHFASIAWYGPARIALWVRRAMKRVALRFSRRPSLATALIAAGYPVQSLADCWATGLPVDPRVAGFGVDAARNNVYGYLFGADLIPAESGCICIELNLNAAIRADRDRFYDVDPIGTGIFDFALARGLSRVVLLGPDWAPVNAKLRSQMDEHSRRTGIAITVLEDPKIVLDGGPYWIPRIDTTDTLVIQLRYFGIGPDRLVHGKVPMHQALAGYLQCHDDRSFRAAALHSRPVFAEAPLQARMPNLVYKYADYDRGEGVHFIKAGDAAEAERHAQAIDQQSGHRDGLYQAFFYPRSIEDDLLYDLRSFGLVTGAGTAYLGSLRKQSATPLPARLEHGVVRDRRPFLMNPYFGNDYARAGSGDEQAASAAIAGIGRALTWAINRHFVVRL